MTSNASVVHGIANSFAALGIEGKNSSWILNGGATYHVANYLHCFTNYRDIFNVFVNLPDKTTLQVTQIGTVKLSD